MKISHLVGENNKRGRRTRALKTDPTPVDPNLVNSPNEVAVNQAQTPNGVAANGVQQIQGTPVANTNATNPVATNGQANNSSNANPSQTFPQQVGSKLAGAGRAIAQHGPGVIRNIGNLASAGVGGIAQAAGAAIGGLGRGYHTARSGNSFGSALGGFNNNSYSGDPYRSSGGSGANDVHDNSSTNKQIADLKAEVQKLKQNAGIQETQVKSTELRPHVRRRAS